MNKTLGTILIVIEVLVLAGGIFFAGSMYARANAYGPSMMFDDRLNNNNAYHPGGMMDGGYGMMGTGRSDYGLGSGMMNGNGWNNRTNSNVTPLTAAEKYVQSIDISGLEVGEAMIFDNNAYVIVKESETGLGAFELLVDPATQIAYPEYGPNMMWNLKYGGLNHAGMMDGHGNMMGNWNYQTAPSSNVSAEMIVTSEQSIEYAQKYLDDNYTGANAATDPMQFYGYYTLDFEKDGKVVGMLSVNGYSGQIFLHTWHGTFIEESK